MSYTQTEELENKVKKSFKNAKQEIEQLKEMTRIHSGLIEQLDRNQSVLLARIRELEIQLDEKKKK